MEKVIFIALSLLGIKNEVLTTIINSKIPVKDLKKILRGKSIEIQYKYSIDFVKYEDLLNDKIKVKEAIDKAEYIVKESQMLGIKIVTIKSRFYPKNLREIKNSPAVLYMKGRSFTKRDEKAIACVGTRLPTEFGIRAASSIVGSLADEDFVIISGLAMGIDSESHKACLNKGGRTVAVLAHGLDIIYPKENELLAERILNQGGTLVSEYPIGTKPDKFRFVQRNKIIAGMSKGTILFESKEKSGTMHTINYTLDQNKKVFCPIPLKYELETSGLIKLLKENKAIGIRTKDNYDLIIYKLGYKVKKDRKIIIRNKNKNINKLVHLNENILNDISSIEFDKKASFGIEKGLYAEFKNILKENNLTLKEFFYGVIKKVVDDYKKGEKNE